MNYKLTLPIIPLQDLRDYYNDYDESTQRFIDFIDAFNIDHKIINDQNPNQLLYEFQSNDITTLETLRNIYISPKDPNGFSPNELPIYF